MKLAADTFATVVASTPLVSIDLLVRNNAGQILLGERLNRPAQGYWFVPGGRILKDESMADAFRRLTRVELGIALEIGEARFLGPYEHFYNDNVFSDEPGKAFSTHYVVLGYEVTLDLPADTFPAHLPKEQHGNYRWLTDAEMLADPQVHLHSRWYLDKNLES